MKSRTSALAVTAGRSFHESSVTYMSGAVSSGPPVRMKLWPPVSVATFNEWPPVAALVDGL